VPGNDALTKGLTSTKRFCFMLQAFALSGDRACSALPVQMFDSSKEPCIHKSICLCVIRGVDATSRWQPFILYRKRLKAWHYAKSFSWSHLLKFAKKIIKKYCPSRHGGVKSGVRLLKVFLGAGRQAVGKKWCNKLGCGCCL